MAKDEGSIILGLLLCWLFNVVHFGIAALVFGFTGERYMEPVFVLVLSIGILQLVYIVPIFRLLKRRGKRATAKGLIIAASITALLNATCWAGTLKI